jgi:hypothetical protein
MDERTSIESVWWSCTKSHRSVHGSNTSPIELPYRLSEDQGY